MTKPLLDIETGLGNALETRALRSGGRSARLWPLLRGHRATTPKTPDEIGLVGRWLAEIPGSLRRELQIDSASNRHWFWLAEGKDAFYKLTQRSSQGASRVRWEASILEGLQHPNIPGGRLIQRGEWDIARIECVKGQPLSRIRDELNAAEKYRILDDIEAVLGYINSERVLHADVQPDNILWDGKSAHLIDFEDSVKVRIPVKTEESPDFVGGPPCCRGGGAYGYTTSHCFGALRRWLLKRNYESLKKEILQSAGWDPSSVGNTCEPWTTGTDGSVYQSLSFGDDYVPGQRDPELRVRYLAARKWVRFEGKTVLDVGCNMGRLGAFLNTLGIARYVGVDIDARFTRLAHELSLLEGRLNSVFLSGDVTERDVAEAIHGLSPGGYDFIVCMSVYHHIQRKDVFWDMIEKVGCKWFVFEGPVLTALNRDYLLKESWSAEKQFLKDRGYTLLHESIDNDYEQRVVAVFERNAASDLVSARDAHEARGI